MRNVVVSVQDLGEIWEEKMSLKSQPLSPFFTKKYSSTYAELCKMTKCAHPASRDLAEFNNLIYLERT